MPLDNPDRERLLVLEHAFASFKEETRKSLNQGANTFAKLDGKIEEVNKVLRPSIAKVAAWFCAFIMTAAIPVCVTIFKLGKYPDAESFVTARADAQAMVKSLDDRVKTLEVSRAEQEVRLRSIADTLGRLETKLDTALSARRQR